MKSLQKILHIDDATYVRKHVFGRAVYLQRGTLQRVSEAADLKWSTVELKPALWAKRITAEHHPVSMARWKSFSTLRRTVSVLYALATDWPYCMFSDFTLTYHQLSTVNSCASAASVAAHVNMHRRLFGKVLNLVSRLGLQLKMPSVCWLQIPDDSLHSEQSGVLESGHMVHLSSTRWSLSRLLNVIKLLIWGKLLSFCFWRGGSLLHQIEVRREKNSTWRARR